MDRKRGYTYLGIDVICLTGFIISLVKEDNYKKQADELSSKINATDQDYSKADDFSEKASDMETLSQMIINALILNHLVSAIDAGYTTPHYNEELKKKYKLSFTPKLNKYSKQPMLSLNINF